jgi:quercetin dioxygenase-like cupin family protein
MDKQYTYFSDLQATVEEIPAESIVSRTIFRGDGMKAIVFAFAPGQELSEHTASVPAVIHVLEGECELTLGGDSFPAGPGAWAAMKPNLPHSLLAKTPVRMLLIMQG